MSRGRYIPKHTVSDYTIPPEQRRRGGYWDTANTPWHRRFPGFALLPSITSGFQYRSAVSDVGKQGNLVDIKAISRELNRLLAICGLPMIGARFVVWHVGRWVLMNAIYLTPVDTGQAARGWGISPQLRGKNRVGVRIRNSVGYLKYLEYGTARQPPKFMLRKSIAEAREQLQLCMDVLLHEWVTGAHTLRNMSFDLNLKRGSIDMESKLPAFTWQKLMYRLEKVLPLDKDIDDVNNVSWFMAKSIDDPKDWHTVHDFEENFTSYEGHYGISEKDVFARHDMFIEELGETVEISRYVKTVRVKRPKWKSEFGAAGGRQKLKDKAAELEKKWRNG